MSERVRQTGEVVETIRNGSIENLQMVALNKPPLGPLNSEVLLDYLDQSGVVRSIATAVHLNNLNQNSANGSYTGHEPDVIKRRSVAQGFHCGFITDFDKSGADTRKERSRVYLQGVRQNKIDPDRKSPFDYTYRLDLPIRSYEGRDFRVNPEGAPVKAYCDSLSFKLKYDSQKSSYCIGAEELVSILQDAISDLISTIQDKEFSPQEKRDLPARLETYMKLSYLLGL